MATKTNVEIVEDIDRCTKIVKQLEKYQFIAVDAEGINLGKDGPLTLLQIGTPDDEVYIFDVLKNKNLLRDGRLKPILQSEEIVKVAHLVIEEHKGRKLPSLVKLSEICNIYSKTAQVSDHKDSLKEMWTTSDGELWAKRPLTEEMIQYASGDVTALIPEVYETQKSYLESNNLLKLFNSRVFDEINYKIDPSVSARIQERTDAIAKRIISEFDQKYGPDTEFKAITNEDDIKALQLVRFDNPTLSPLARRLKTDSIKNRLKTLRDQLHEEGDNFIPKQRSFGFLTAYQHLPDKTIQREAKELRDRVNQVVLKCIEKKYNIYSRLAVITDYEKESLLSIRASSEHDPKYDPVVLSLYWQLQEDDLIKTTEHFRIDQRNYNIPEGKYRWLKYVRNGNVPQGMKEMAKKHLQDLDKMFGRGKCPFSK